MKTSSRLPLQPSVLALLCALSLSAFAQQPPASTEKITPPAQPAAADATPPATTPAAEPPPAAADSEKEKPLRRIDEAEQDRPKRTRNSRRNVNHGAPQFGGDYYVTEGNRVHEAVSIWGSNTIDGEVSSDAVSIFGNTTVGPKGKVSGAVVAVLGSLDIKGDVRHEAVTILGGGTIDGHVGQEVVSILGDLKLGPNAVIDGDVVSVGGTLTKDPKAIVNGNEVRVPLFFGKNNLEGLASYVRNCVAWGRPLAFAPHLGWAWAIAACFFVFYLVLSLLFSGPLTKCVQTLETKPGASVLAAVLTVLLTPVAIILLCFTVIGIVLVPFVVLGLIFAALFGKATMLAWIGRRFTKFFGDGMLNHIFFAVLIGGVIVLLLYTVPVFGFLLLKLLGWLGMGVVVYTIMLGMKRPKPAVAHAVATGAGASAAASGFVPAPVWPAASAPMTGTLPETPAGAFSEPAPSPAEPTPPAFGAVPVAPMPPPVAPPSFAPQPVLFASTLPRAGFFIRLGALLLDIILLAVITAFFAALVPRGLRFLHMEPPGMLPVLAAYGAIMWKLKGTTIGGIICGLKVVRLDNRPLDWPTAVVRALGCFLSFVVVGLGFIWVAIDDEKQSWHDKIAGTTVVHVPKGVSLL
jgi:uncharacterized RDD family membrane protein YckC